MSKQNSFVAEATCLLAVWGAILKNKDIIKTWFPVEKTLVASFTDKDYAWS